MKSVAKGFEYVFVNNDSQYYKFEDGRILIYGVASYKVIVASQQGIIAVKLPTGLYTIQMINIQNIYTHSNSNNYNPFIKTDNIMEVHYMKNNGLTYNIGETVDFKYEIVGRWK